MRQHIRNFPQFTHFACLPFCSAQQRETIFNLQKTIKDIVGTRYPQDSLVQSNYNLAHVTLSMLILHRADTRVMFRQAFTGIKERLREVMSETSLTFCGVKYFSRLNQKTKVREVTLIYLQIQQNEQYNKILKSGDIFIRSMLKSQIISSNQLKQMRISYSHNENIYRNEEYHLTLFRVKDVVEDQEFQAIFKEIDAVFKSVVFQCRSIDISIRNHYQGDGFYCPFERVELADCE